LVEAVRDTPDPQVAAVVARYDALLAAAQTKQRQVGAMPYPEHKAALQVEHVPPCDNK
jgi:hypothetical protein